MPFGKATQLEKRARAAQPLYDYMDQLEAKNWEWRLAGNAGNEDLKQRLQREAPDAPTALRHLYSVCGGDVNVLMDLLGEWQESREAYWDKYGSEDRVSNVAYLHLAIAVTGVGNMFGFIPPHAPAFDPKLANEGRKLGWRR